MSDCFKKNELMIPGTRQDQRSLEALKPSYVLADERSIADLLVFISNYATCINYYALKGTDQKDYAIDGDWKPIIMSDEAFNYAGISVTPYTFPNISFYKYVNLYETGSNAVMRDDAYRVLWDILFSVYKDINSFYAALPVYMQLRSVIQTEIKNNLVTNFGIAASAYLNASDPAILNTVNLHVPTNSDDDDYKFGYAADIINGGFDKIWIDGVLAPSVNDWNGYLAILNLSLPVAKQFFNSAFLPNVQDMIDYSTIQLKQIFKSAFETYARIIAIANEYLQISLHNNSSHYAHHGLMLAFLKLFGVLQLDINEFTRKHLEYYYSRVLQINPAAAVPDAAHIVFEPAKNITQHLIKKDTALNGGKDGTGKLLLYNTDDEIVISQAKVEQLKTIFLKPIATAGVVSKVYASPFADSSDGNGAAFTGDDNSWKGFGDVRKDEVTSNESNEANLGFYIASPVLHLTEGNRVIDFVFTTDAAGMVKANALTKANLIKMLSISYSGEKQWEQLIINDSIITDFNSEMDFVLPGGNTFSIRLTLSAQCKPWVGYDVLVCDGSLATVYPVIKMALKQDDPLLHGYQGLNGITIQKITIITTVSEITNLSLQNDLGPADASKPVQLFGPNPKKSSTFYIGHPELEHKKVTSFNINLEWLDLNPAIETLSSLYSYIRPKVIGSTTSYPSESYVPGVTANSSFKIKAGFLRNKNWYPDPNTAPENSLFTAMPLLVTLTNDALKPALTNSQTYLNGNIPFNPGTQNGFIRLTLSSPADAFGHAIWPVLFAKQTIALTNDKDATHNSIPNPPYTPLLKSIKFQYTAEQEINFETGKYKSVQGEFFHIMPFGHQELSKGVTLLPEFKLQVKKEDGTMEYKPLESATYIGISNAVIKENISLLIQVNEGSEDISVDTPKVSWNYLSGSGWKNLDKSLLADSTAGLLKSGIVSFSIPVDVNNKSTELPAGITWIMASIEPGIAVPFQTASNGLPKLLAVYANAVKVTFKNAGNDPEHLAKALPANSISKLFESDAAVKKVKQPYASFGGKKIEEGKFFYTRVSERLRHKHRAITIWDYEHLILNEFTEVYMVKCLNHTGYEKDCTTSIIKYKENIPGRVMLVPVPFITNLQTGNIYQPTLSAAKLGDIKNFIHGGLTSGACNKYIKALHCQLSTLLVENPKYETIKVFCKIKVRKCSDPNFYKAQLGEDLNKFLAPWITGDAGKISFGGRLHVSQVVYFIEQLSYIDYLEDLTIEHKDGSTILNTAEPGLAVASTSRSVLTSIGNDINGKPQHSINLL